MRMLIPVLPHKRSCHGRRRAPRALLRRFLQSHDVEVQVRALSSAGSRLGDTLLSMAADVGANLMVMGCYGHSRGREWILGGATRSVLQSMTIPVLMAH